MMAGATPMPEMPSWRSFGKASDSAASGPIKRPKSAIDGMVCTMSSPPKTRVCQRGRRCARMPSGTPMRSARQHRNQDKEAVTLDGVGEGFAPVRRFLGERELIERARERGDGEHGDDADHDAGLGRKAGVEAAQGIARREHRGEAPRSRIRRQARRARSASTWRRGSWRRLPRRAARRAVSASAAASAAR